jgi:hypothetical protein
MTPREEEEATPWRFKAGKKEVEAMAEGGGSYHAIQQLLPDCARHANIFWRCLRMSKDLL